MSLSEWLPKLHTLPRAEKLQLIQYLAVDLAREEGVPPVEPGIAYPIWSPYGEFDAADVMLKALVDSGVDR